MISCNESDNSDSGLEILEPPEESDATEEAEREAAFQAHEESLAATGDSSDDDMRPFNVIDDNTAHEYINYTSGLNLGILRDYLEEEERSVEDCVLKLNEFVVQVMDSPTPTASLQVLVDTANDGIKWETWNSTLLHSQIAGFTVFKEVEEEEKGKLKRKRKEFKISFEWQKSLDRNWVKKMKYDPSLKGGVHGNELLNTFTGFPFHGKYNPGIFLADHDLARRIINFVVNHLREVLCRGNKKIYKFVKTWMRVVRQHPEFRPEVILVFIGEEESGKSSFFKHYAKLFGKNAVYLAEPKSLTTKFAGDQLDDKVLVCCDEADFNNKEYGYRLKNLVTAESRHYEKKRINAKQVKNYLNGIFTTNSKKCLPISSTGRNRRYFPVTVSDKYVGNKAYFQEMETLLGNDFGMQVFDFWLRAKRVPAERLHPPLTEELNNMKVGQLSNLQNWWLEKLDAGCHLTKSSIILKPDEIINIEEDDQWLMFPVDIGALYGQYNLTKKSKLERGDFVNKLRAILPKDGTEINHYQLSRAKIPNLQKCKEFAFEKLGVQPKEFIKESEKHERKHKKWGKQARIDQFLQRSS